MYRIFALIICDSVLQRLSFCTNILMVTWGCKKWLTANISLGSTLSKTTVIQKKKILATFLFWFYICLVWCGAYRFFVSTHYGTWYDYKIFFLNPELFYEILLCNNWMVIIVVMGNKISFTNEREGKMNCSFRNIHF